MSDIEPKLYKRKFWAEENLNYVRPHLRMKKAARLINKIAEGEECALLDVGCGPATIATLLDPNIQYFGIDIAIQEPAPNLLETDFLEEGIRFSDARFDIVLAQGVFEYVAGFQEQKLAEIADVMKPDGVLVVSYVNFQHRDRRIYAPYSNVMSFDEFQASVARFFTINRIMPTSHHWVGRPPRAKLFEIVQMPLNTRIPGVSRWLAVEYLIVCSEKH